VLVQVTGPGSGFLVLGVLPLRIMATRLDERMCFEWREILWICLRGSENTSNFALTLFLTTGSVCPAQVRSARTLPQKLPGSSPSQHEPYSRRDLLTGLQTPSLTKGLTCIVQGLPETQFDDDPVCPQSSLSVSTPIAPVASLEARPGTMPGGGVSFRHFDLMPILTMVSFAGAARELRGR
jgi:hypothetical protein